MTERAIHCPFLNRSDERCSSHFSLDSLSDAFEQCFNEYEACSFYRELLLERRVRRVAASLLHPGQASSTEVVRLRPNPGAGYTLPLVQLTHSTLHRV